MKLKKRNWTLIIMLVLIILSIYLLSIIGLAFLGVVIAILLLSAYILLSQREKKKIYKQITSYIEQKQYELAIVYISFMKNKIYFNDADEYFNTMLVILYMYNNQKEEAIKILNNFYKLEDHKDLFFINFILAIDEKDSSKAIYYVKKLLNLEDSSFDNQKEEAKKILLMIKNKTKDEELYNTTLFPLVKEICDNIDNFNDLEINQDTTYEIKEPDQNNKQYTGIKKLLNTLSIVFIFIPWIIIGLIIILKEPVMKLEIELYLSRYKWIVLLSLIIPVLNFILSMKLENNHFPFKKNLVTSIICIMISLLSMIITNGYVTTNKKYLTDLETKMELEIPDKYDIMIDHTHYTIEKIKTIKVLKTIIVRFDQEEEESIILPSIIQWNNNPNYIDFTLPLYKRQENKYDRLSIYCKDTNEIYPSTNRQPGYTYVAIGYDIDTKHLLIYEFKYVEE